MRHSHIFFSVVLSFLLITSRAWADDFSSSNFTIKDPVFDPAGYGSSSSYGLWGSIPDIASTNGSSTDFAVLPGFLAFSGVTMPLLSATASTTTIDASWTAATGATVTYEPGYATSSGGSYLFSAPQTTRTATFSGLATSTAYYVIVRVKEQSGGALLGYSNELAISTLSGVATTTTQSRSISIAGTALAPVGWVYGPDGLVPLTGDYPATSSQFWVAPGESVPVAPALLRQFGAVVTGKGAFERIVAGARVTLLRLNAETGAFEPWPNGAMTVTTDAYGLYSFVVPAGTYRVLVSASGYLDYAGGVVEVRKTGQLNQRIELIRRLEVAFPAWPFILLLLVGCVFFFVIVWAIFRR